MESDKLESLSARKLAFEEDPSWESHPEVAFRLLDDFEEQLRFAVAEIGRLKRRHSYDPWGMSRWRKPQT